MHACASRAPVRFPRTVTQDLVLRSRTIDCETRGNRVGQIVEQKPGMNASEMAGEVEEMAVVNVEPEVELEVTVAVVGAD